MKKAQITFFILFAFAILLAIGIATILVTQETNTLTNQETMNKPKTILQAQSIKDEVNNCLELTAKEALQRIGKQGGYLYQQQGGSAQDLSTTDLGITYVDYDNYKTRYLIDEPVGNMPNRFYTTSPQYPWDLFPYTDNSFTTTQFDGYYGINQLPPLYKPALNSLQQQLEIYIANNTKKCVDFTKYQQQGLEITTKAPNVTMYIANETQKLRTEETTNFILDWSITIKQKTTNITTTINDFGTTIRIPFAKIYYNITSIINKDVTNINYEPHTEDTYITSKTKINQDSIITLKFVSYIVDNMPYEFTFARHHRLPALQYITAFQDNTPQTPINLPKGAIIAISGTTLEFLNAKCSSQNAPQTGLVIPPPPSPLANTAQIQGTTNIIQLFTSDPDGEINNPNIQYKLNPENPNLNTPTIPGHPMEIQVITQKIDDPTKKDWQTFYVSVYCCAAETSC